MTHPATSRAALSVGAVLLISTSALAQTPDALTGLWRAADGSNAVAIAPCGNGSGQPNLCATLAEQRSQPGDPSSLGQVVLRDLRSGRNGVWTARYVADGQNLGATVRVLSADQVEFRVCAVGILCETERYARVKR